MFQAYEEALRNKSFLSRTPSEHLTFGALRAPQVAWAGLADASGWSFLHGSYWRARYKKAQWGLPKDSMAIESGYLIQRYKGATHNQALRALQGGHSGRVILRGGRYIGALGLYTTLNLARDNQFGAGYGMASELSNIAAFGAGGRMGWAAGAALGTWVGGPVGAVAGAVIGGLTGAIVPSAALSYAADELPMLGYRLSRRGFGSLFGSYRDNQQVATMRQASIAAISQSQLNARSALGGEAALLHFA